MPWNVSRTSRNTLHVMDTATGSHFEAADEEEAQATIDAHLEALEEKKRAAEESEKQTSELTTVAGDVPTLRSN